MAGGVVLSRRAVRDLQRIGGGLLLVRIREALEALAAGASNLDIKPLAGAAPWHRLRVGDYRVLYRPVDSSETVGSDARWLVARIVHRRDLERAVSALT
jgi:mRNA-degrading endonuclease RelE of RelBE toxin-antitoxin system